MIKIFNKSLQPVAILENAFNVSYEKSFNEIWQSSFSLPLADPKNEDCKPLNYMELTDDATGEYIGLFRIIPSSTVKDESSETVSYQCEHVLSCLLDDVLFRYHQVDGLPTKDSMQYILDKQNTKRWKIGTVSASLNRYFSFKWENENLLSALFSIPKPLDKPYQWTWDTSSFPWTLNLLEVETVPSCEIRYGKNQRGIEKEEDPTVSYNRIYALGQGEGVNALDITKVNNGIPFVEDTESINKYGLRQFIFSDRRFESAATLKSTVQALLEKWKNPKITFRVSAADVSSITQEDIDKLKMGKVVRMVDPDLGAVEARIMRESKSDMKGQPGDLQLEIASKTEDLGTTQADLLRRQSINELYSQGNTVQTSYSYNDNCDSTHPAEITFFLSDDMVKVNELKLFFETENFRAYEQAVGGGGSQTVTSKSGGSSTITSTVTSASGGSATVTSEFTAPTFFLYSSTRLPLTNATFDNHVHALEVTNELNHRHGVSIPSHQHSVSVPVNIPAHTHEIELQDHVHDLQFGIFTLSDLPTKVTIKIDGNTVPYTSTSGEGIDLIPYINKDADGNVSRGKHTLTITPDKLGRISAQLNTQFFLQSRGQYSL
jgi:phage minor structural protein